MWIVGEAGGLVVRQLDTICPMRTNLLRLTLAFILLPVLVLLGCGGSGSSTPLGPAVYFYYVADTGNNRIVRFESFAAPTDFTSYGSVGSAQNQLMSPT